VERHIDLGLAVSATSLASGCARSVDELAAYCDCDPSRISAIEQEALRKLRGASPDLLDELGDLRSQADGARPRVRRAPDNFDDVLEAAARWLAAQPQRRRRVRR